MFNKEVAPGLDRYADVRNVSFWFPRGGVFTGANLDPRNGVFGEAFIAEQNFEQGEQRKRVTFILKRRVNSEDRIEWELTAGESR